MATVVIYTRKLCGFCTAAKSLLSRKGVAFREIDATFDAGLRQEMMRKSGRSTFPQIFVGGQHVGGATETFDAFNSGQLQAALLARSIGFDTSMTADAYSFLPSWLHPR